MIDRSLPIGTIFPATEKKEETHMTSERMSDDNMCREANEFAMHLLVPSDFLRAELTKMGGIDLEDDRAIAKLARKFRVSMQVMTLRIGQELSQWPA